MVDGLGTTVFTAENIAKKLETTDTNASTEEEDSKMT
jgi:hypothetical protein